MSHSATNWVRTVMTSVGAAHVLHNNHRTSQQRFKLLPDTGDSPQPMTRVLHGNACLLLVLIVIRYYRRPTFYPRSTNEVYEHRP